MIFSDYINKKNHPNAQTSLVNPGFAAKKPKVVEKKKPAGFQQQAKFRPQPMMHMGNRSEDVVNVNSQFVPTRKIFVVVANRHYEEKRNIPRFSEFKDIPEVDADLVNVKKGL